MAKQLIHGHTVNFEDDAEPGIYYLTHDLNPEEQKVFFDQAYSHGSAEFENHSGIRFKLVHKNYEYELLHIG